MPKVSICIPNYNYGHYIGEAIESVLAQMFSDWELIICDNASTDDTETVVVKYNDPRIIYKRYDVHVSMYENFNRCLSHANGSHVLFLSSDDMLMPDTIRLLSEGLDAHPDAAICIAYMRQAMDQEGKPFGKRFHKPIGPDYVSGEEAIVSLCYFDKTVGNPSEVLIRMSAIRMCGNFDPVADDYADYELWCRLASEWDYVYVEDAVSLVRIHNDNARFENQRRLEDIRARHYVFSKLFKESTVLRGNRKLKYVFVACRLYPWFERALHLFRQGDFCAGLWVLSRIVSIDPIPWWLVYFTGKKIRKTWRYLHAMRRKSAVKESCEL